MDLTAFNTSANIIHISVSEFLVYSFYSSNTEVKTRCMMHQKTNPAAEQTTTVTAHDSYFTGTPYVRTVISTTNNFANTNGIWFYLRCAMTLDNDKYIVYGQMQGTTYPATVTESTIPLETLFTDASPSRIDMADHYRYIYRKSDTMTLKILNANTVGTAVYIKNLYILQEYLRENIQFQY